MDRPRTVRDALDLAEAALREAVILQQRAPTGPLDDIAETNHYLWGYALTELAEQAEQAGRLIAGQLNELGQSASLRDDAGMPVGDRIDLATSRLDELVGHAVALAGCARRFHTEVGHFGLEFPDEAT